VYSCMMKKPVMKRWWQTSYCLTYGLKGLKLLTIVYASVYIYSCIQQTFHPCYKVAFEYIILHLFIYIWCMNTYILCMTSWLHHKVIFVYMVGNSKVVPIYPDRCGVAAAGSLWGCWTAFFYEIKISIFTFLIQVCERTEKCLLTLFSC
jgi:hypothetical protein